MIQLGTLNEVEGYTFAYSGNLTLGDKQYIVVAFETRIRNEKGKFEIKIVDSKEELDVVIKSMNVKKDEPKPKTVFDWASGEVNTTPPVQKPKPNKTLSLF
jgi:hypothetical protein